MGMSGGGLIGGVPGRVKAAVSLSVLVKKKKFQLNYTLRYFFDQSSKNKHIPTNDQWKGAAVQICRNATVI